MRQCLILVVLGLCVFLSQASAQIFYLTDNGVTQSVSKTNCKATDGGRELYCPSETTPPPSTVVAEPLPVSNGPAVVQVKPPEDPGPVVNAKKIRIHRRKSPTRFSAMSNLPATVSPVEQAPAVEQAATPASCNVVGETAQSQDPRMRDKKFFQDPDAWGTLGAGVCVFIALLTGFLLWETRDTISRRQLAFYKEDGVVVQKRIMAAGIVFHRHSATFGLDGEIKKFYKCSFCPEVVEAGRSLRVHADKHPPIPTKLLRSAATA